MKKFIFVASATLVSLWLLVSTTSCNDSKPETKITDLKTEKKVRTPIRTEYNPVVASKSCGEPTMLKLHIPKPDNSIVVLGSKEERRGFKPYLVKVFMDSALIQSIEVEQNFHVLKDSTEFSPGYQIIETTIPRYSQKSNDNGNLTIKFFTSLGELITEYTTKYFYLEDDAKMKVIKRRDLPMDSFTYHIPLPNGEVIKETGQYKDDTKYTHKIVKHKDKYISTYSAQGKGIYRRDKVEDDWGLAFNVPVLPVLTSEIPLEFELEEKEYTYGRGGYSTIEPKLHGKAVVFHIYEDVLGKEMMIGFNNCEKVVEEKKTISIESFSGWSTIK